MRGAACSVWRCRNFFGKGYPGIWNAIQGLLSGLERSDELSRKMLAETDRKALDEQQGVSLEPQHAAFSEERVEQLASALEDRTVPDETIQRRARAGNPGTFFPR